MSEFTDAIKHNLENLNVMPGPACGMCSECDYRFDLDEDGRPETQPDDEGGFSWSSCDSCGSTFGGDRFIAHAFIDNDHTNALLHLDICVDCLMFHANGDEPETWRQHP